MEEKQLDFNQPFLSARRFSPKVASETDKKSKTTSSNSSARLPPLPTCKSDLKSGPLSHPGAVPFIWEQTPGRPKNEGKLPTFGVEQPPLAPNLPPGRASRVKHQDSDQIPKRSTVSKSATKHKILKEAIQEKDSSNSDDGDEAYQDALDTLSTTESFFMNCSASGLSGLDDQEIQPSGSFSGDQQARNFMIGRFLPAAKAMASGSLQYTSRKPPVAEEEPRQVKKVVSRQRYSPLRQIVLSHYAQDFGEGESENEDDDNESVGSENHATKVCRLFPGFCFWNPLPELRMKDRVLSSAAHGMQAKSSTTHSGARKEHAITSNKEKKSVYSKFGFGEEKVKNGIDQQRRGSSKLSAFESTQCGFRCASPVVEKTLYIDYVHKDKLHSNSSSSAMKGQTNHTWDPFKTSIKDSGNCKKISIDPKISESLDLPFNCCPCRSSNDVQMHVTNHSNKLELEKQSSTEPLEHEIDSAKNSAISNPQVAQCSKTLSDNLVIRNQENFDGPVQNPASWRGSRLAGDVEVDLKSLVAARSTDQECSKRVSDGRTDLENQCQKRLGNQDEINLRLSFSLLSPKAPSDSWLKRTLPIISSSNAIAKIPACCRITNTATHDPKWERIVRSSEELLTPIPED